MSKAKLPKSKGQVAIPAKESLEAFRALINGAKEYSKVREEEATKRCQIQADLKRDMEKIKGQRQFLEDYLRTTFDERRNTIDRMFERLDLALAEDKDQVAIQALASIEGIVKSSPLEPLLTTQRALENQGCVLEI